MENETVVSVFVKDKNNGMANPKIDLYYFIASPPCRSVMMLAKALGLQLNMKVVNVMAGEQMTPEYLRLNPQHSIPTLNDDGLVLFESRAILQYLVDEYGKDDSLAPKNPRKAAMVNQRLYFDACTLSPRLIQYFFPVIAHGQAPNKEYLQKFEEALGLLDEFLENQTWVAGSQLSIADFAIIATISTAEAVNIDITKHANVGAWYQRAKNAMQSYGYDEINQTGVAMIGGMFKSKLGL